MSSERTAPSGSQSFRLGVGLLIGLALGHRSVLAAATGAEQFEPALGHFVLVVLASVVGVSGISSTYERLAIGTEVESEAESDSPEPVVGADDEESPLPTLSDPEREDSLVGE